MIVVATDDDRIAAACASFGARCLLTAPEHATGTDRLAEAATQLALPEDEIIVNVQGDEPLIEGFVIDAAVQALEEDPDAGLALEALPELIDQLEAKMKEAAKKLDFEDAANLRDRIKQLRQKMAG